MDKVKKEEFAKKIAYRIETLANDKCVNVATLLNMCGLPRSTVDNMKNGRMPNADKLYVLAEFLNVSTDSLLGLEQRLKKKDAQDGAPLTIDTDDEDFKVYRSLPKDIRKQALGFMRFLAEQETSGK